MKLSTKYQITSSKGFTLIETIIVIAVVGVIGVIMADVLTQTFRGQAKSAVISQAKQNGQVVLDQLDKLIKNSESIVCVGRRDPNSIKNDTLVVANRDKGLIRIRFMPQTDTENSYIQIAYPTVPASIAVCSNPNLDNNVTSVTKLTDTNRKTGIAITNGSFDLNSSPGYPDAVAVGFHINSASDIKTVENLLPQGGVEFKTTIELR